MKQNKRGWKGFTLAELVISMAVLVLLVGFAIPVFQSIQQDSKNAMVKSSLGEMRAAIQAYSATEIAAGRASRNAQGAAGGWPVLAQVDDSNYSTTSLPKVLPNGDVPENPYAKKVFTQDYDRVIASSGPAGNNAYSWLFEEGTAYAVIEEDTGERVLIVPREGGSSGGGGGDPPPPAGGWNYNAITGEIWARTNVNGENYY